MLDMLAGPETRLVPDDDIRYLPSAGLLAGSEVVFGVRLEHARMCWARSITGTCVQHQTDHNGLAVCIRHDTRDRLFARCFSQKCTPDSKDPWIELTEDHARRLNLVQ